MAIVPHAGPESFWALRDYYAIPESATNYWVGAHPRLDIPDGAVRYGSTTFTDDFELVGTAARLAAFTWPDPQGVRISAQVRLSGSWSGGYGMVVLGFLTEGSGDGWPLLHIDRNGIWDQVEATADGEWATVSVTLAPFRPNTWQPEAKAAAAAGALWVYATGNPDVEQVFDVSWLQVETLGASAHPLRWRQRNDGLGGGSPRAARGVTSQQGSNRHRGYL